MAFIPGIHRIQEGHLIRSGAVVPGLRSDDEQPVWIGAYTTVQGGIVHAGSVILGRGSVTWDGIAGGPEVVLGAGCTVDGGVRAVGRIVVQHGATVNGALQAGSDVHLLGDCTVQDVDAGGDILIVGSPKTGQLRPCGRVSTRAF